MATEPELPEPDFEPRPETTSFAVVEEVAETIVAVEALQDGPTASPELERAAQEAAVYAREQGIDGPPEGLDG
ncbi:hypothetical protein [Demequina lignilytica]|uniref:Uncharacterized protein n=1 Tax=Demequina lignilytica TaxID=3051663 RepID=A0AB35MHT7_9MICO|nr:hypothetical protein [Demequina sp. SYSU T0a273]MDN4483338.1 hypothetical protein [Demequina sp. SYSU T0a273]